MKNANSNQLTLPTWTKDSMWNVLSKSDEQLVKALVKLYDFQTASEKHARDTKYFNGVGFNGTDGKFLSSCSTYYMRFGYLSKKQIYCIRKRLKKYAGQLANIANGTITKPLDPGTARNTFTKKLPAMTQPQVDYEVSSNYIPDHTQERFDVEVNNEEPMSLHEYCKIESGGLTGQALKQYISKYYGHD